MSNCDKVLECTKSARVVMILASLGGSRGVWYRPHWLCRRSAAAGAGCAQLPAAGRIAQPQGVKKNFCFSKYAVGEKEFGIAPAGSAPGAAYRRLDLCCHYKHDGMKEFSAKN